MIKAFTHAKVVVMKADFGRELNAESEICDIINNEYSHLKVLTLNNFKFKSAI